MVLVAGDCGNTGVSIPFKIKFMKWQNKRRQEKKNSQRGKWGDEVLK